MSEANTTPPAPAPAPTGLAHPQVLIALITGIVTVVGALIGIVPSLIEANKPTPTPTFTFTPTFTVTFTPTAELPTATATPAPAEVVLPTSLPLLTAAPPPGSVPNALLIFDGVSFTLVNTAGRSLSLQGVRFRSSSGRFDSVGWANHTRIPDGSCVRIRDAAAGRRNPPPECANLLSLLEVGPEALFWANTPTFEVVRDSVVLASCPTDTDRCAVYIPPN